MSLSDGSAEKYAEIKTNMDDLAHEYARLQTMKTEPGSTIKRKALAKEISRKLRDLSLEIDKVAVQSLLPRYQSRYYRRIYESMS